MRTSKFTREEKINIINHQKENNCTVEETCVLYGISTPTFYTWKRELAVFPAPQEQDNNDLQSLRKENVTLKQLYIDLSEHNHQLAQFLNQ